MQEGEGKTPQNRTAKWGSQDDEDEQERASATRKLKIALCVCILFMLLEIVGAIVAGSLAVLSDAAHLLSDVAGFAISLLALRASRWTATPIHTFGYFRLEVLGALLSVQIIWLMTGIIIYEAIQRLFRGTQFVDGGFMCLVASLGVVFNLFMIFVLGHGHDHHHHGDVHCHGHAHGEHSHVVCLKNYAVDIGDDGQGQGQGHGHKIQHNHDECHEVGHEEMHNHEHKKQGLLGSTPLTPRELMFPPQEQPRLASISSVVDKRATSASKLPSDDDGGETSSLVTESHSRGENGAVEMHSEVKQGNHNINIRGAYLHALGDLIQSVGVLITGVVIFFKPEWQFIDLLCSFFFSIVVMTTTIRMSKDIVRILMESTPRDVDIDVLRSGLLRVAGVVAVHELHVWALTTGTNVLTCHLHIKPESGGVASDILHHATSYCASSHKIKHITIQIEDAS